MARQHWEFDLNDGHHVVELEHGYFSGKRTITIDGSTTIQRGSPFMDHTGEYPLPLRGHDARLRITPNGLTYFYDLVVDGRSAATGKRAGSPPRPLLGGPTQTRILGVVLAVLAIPLLALGGKAAFDEYRYHTASATAAGTVQEKRIVGGRYGDSYELSYTFVDANGATRTGRDYVPRATYEQARPGMRYVVRYLLDDPNISRLSTRDDTVTAIVPLGFGVATAGMAVFLIAAGLRRMAVIGRVSEIGQPVSATVTKVKREYLRGVGQVATVEYAYDDPFGRRRRGRGPLMYPNEAAAYTVGGPVRVLIDPDRPGDSVLP